MPDLDELVKKRGTLKARLTHFVNYLNKLSSDDAPVILNEIQNIELQERIARIDNLMNDYDEIQLDIECLSENIEEQYSERENFEQNFYAAISKAKLLRGKSAKQIMDSPKSEHEGSVISGVAQENNSVISGNGHQLQTSNDFVKLPVIEMTKFHGNFNRWLEFRDTFESLVHLNERLSDIHKFHYLRSVLKDGALEIIQSIEFCSENYNMAWELLCERYNNTKLLVQTHTKAIFEIENVCQENASKLRKLIDAVSKHLRSLKQLNEPTDKWDTLIIYVIATKLDEKTSFEWEQYKANLKNVPTFDEFKQFLNRRADLLETVELNRSGTKAKAPNSNLKISKTRETTRTLLAAKISCNMCNGEHYLRNCDKFLALSVRDRYNEAKNLKLCVNCLRGGHDSDKCRFRHCQKCPEKHNTLLHDESKRESSSQVTLTSVSDGVSKQVLLSTAILQILDTRGVPHTIRAVLDCGSQSSFIKESVCEQLGLKLTPVNIPVSGLNNMISYIRNKCNITIRSVISDFSANLCCLVTKEITDNLPNTSFEATKFTLPSHVKLADPNFHQSGAIDLLIGADLFWKLVCGKTITLGKNRPALSKTKLGWIVSGIVPQQNAKTVRCHFGKNMDVEFQLQKFWEIEDCATQKILSNEELACEIYYKESVSRCRDGRFMVSIPLKESPESLGVSDEMARKRFFKLEKRLEADESLQKMYTNFMKEYEDLGHMTNVTDEIAQQKTSYHMPHHGVLREQSKTTKLRVVFDASAATSSGKSLNDIQMVGPTVQNDLLSILLRFRKHRYAVTADIEKMYRQVLIKPDERYLQQIFWRADPIERLETYQLNTVTYGCAAASYLAIRSVIQLAIDVENDLPDVSAIIKNDFYVDDLISGSDTIENATNLFQQVSTILNSGRFSLRKWRSNSEQLTSNISNDGENANLVEFAKNEKAKTLGLTWICDSDCFGFNIQGAISNRITKRTVLSAIGQIFDPLGLLSACIIIAKILLQRLWQNKLLWDETLPVELMNTWLKFKEALPALNECEIPRRVICSNPTSIELHAFSDASENAYGASIYIRSSDGNGNTWVRLLCAKSKVAPLKSLTVPRLELCGALTLARVVNKVKGALKINFDSCTFWTDSTIVLGWLGTEPNLLKSFVSNRIAEIQNLSKDSTWRHISTKDNPADLLSRGVQPNQLKDCSLWWNGPSWLSLNNAEWPNSNFQVENLPELRPVKHAFIAKHVWHFPFERLSTLKKLIRCVAYLKRFSENCRVPPAQRRHTPLNVTELDTSLKYILKMAQREMFRDELQILGKEGSINKGPLAKLNPFVDQEGFLRVGGRLANSEFSFDKRHPVILLTNHYLTKLIFEHEHITLLHAGPQQLLFSLREKYWPISGRNFARKIVRDCVRCARFNSKPIQPIMGALPKLRVQANYPFHITGVDYAGPLKIKDKKGRGAKQSKCWLCLFICFCTRAVHLEIVSELTTDAFILTLRRFISRRGKPAKIYSDNGLNFVGTHNELQILGKFISENQKSLQDSFANENIDWQFIPAHSPHFGGLWEAGVKITKHHLKRVAGDASLTYEELSTLIAQIEAIVNSRPLTPLSTDPDDLIPLSPAHFLIGRTMTSLPDQPLMDIPEGRLSRLQRIQQLQQHFWARWHKEVISELQERTKWTRSYGSLQVGTLVLIKDDNLPPLKWRLGRITTIHPGRDGQARVATIRTANGEVKRTFPKICPLPVESQDFQSGGHVRA